MDVRIEDKGACTFEVVEATELIDAARSLTQKRPLWVTTDPPGIGANQLIEWAVSEIEAARKASVDTDVSKHASSAVRFARQALNCQVDWYL